jgi:uncharacterized protein
MPSPPAPPPLGDTQIEELAALLERVPPPMQPLDVTMLDGLLCGVLLQPAPVPRGRWLPLVTDLQGRALPAGFDARPLHALVLRRHAELEAAIAQRRWFDPWVFEVPGETTDPPAPDGGDRDDGDDAPPPELAALLPWVAGFTLAMEWFPALIDRDDPALTVPLALIFRHGDADALEDADEVLAEIESLEPAHDLATGVEELVRATLLLADIGRPRRARR